MPLYRALKAAQHPDGSCKRLRVGEVFTWAGAPGVWMEPVEGQPSPAPSEPAEPAPIPEAAESAATEEAPAESKRARKRKETE